MTTGGLSMTRVPRFEVYRDRPGEWRWRIRAANGKIVADSAEGYTTKRRALQGLHVAIDAGRRAIIRDLTAAG